MPGKKDIILLLDRIADLMEYIGENPFKINAFRNGANAIRRNENELETIIADEKLDTIKGIGKGLQSVIYEFYDTGSSEMYNELKKQVPEGIEDLLKIRGIGSKKIKILNKELGINNIGELESACRENRLALLKGFGEATQKKILQELDKIKIYSKYILLNTAAEYVDDILSKLSRLQSVENVAVSGEVRRGMEIISEIRLVIHVKDVNNFKKDLAKIYNYNTKDDDIILTDSFAVPVKLNFTVTENDFTKILFLTTGSSEFLAKSKIEIDDLSGKTEDEFFRIHRAPYVIPEMREKEYFDVKDSKLMKNSDLSVNKFIGLLHFHTTYSDGRNTLKEMVSFAKKEGFSFAAVCDHSKSAFYANGLTEDRLLLQKKEVKAIGSGLGFPIFHGIESDILQNGDLDYSEDVLREFDFIVASIHSRFSMEHDEMTKRIVRAVENPYTDLLGHPSGRLLLSREPYKFDIKKVIDACAANKTAIEINANPHRLDLDWRLIYYAREKGCMFSINPDAHSTEEIDYIKYGVMVARKGGLMTSEVINCYDLEKFKSFLCGKAKGN